MDNYNQHDRVGRFERYLLNGKYHRTDGPAFIEYRDTTGKLFFEEYCIYGQSHRLDGPARIWYDYDGNIINEAYLVNSQWIVDFRNSVKLMRVSNDKTKTLLNILNEIKEEHKRAAATILVNMFRNDIDQTVVNNIEMFL